LVNRFFEEDAVSTQSCNRLLDYPTTRLSNSAAVWRVIVALFVFVTGAASMAAGGQKWELEFVGGGAFPSSGDGGTTALPPPNSTLSGVPGLQQARIVSSWYFGDGASQLNQAFASMLGLFRTIPTIVPLDPLLQSRFAEREPGPSIGVRFSRVLTPRFSAEFTFESANTKVTLDPASVSGLEASRLSFANAWNGFLSLQAQGTQTVTSVLTTEDGRGRQFMTTGSLLVNLMTDRRLTPYAVVGGGVVTNEDKTASAQLTGRYRFGFPPVPVPVPFPIPTLNVDESDHVTVRTTFDDRFAFALGGGVKYPMTDRFSLRFDVRDFMYGDSQRTELDATPATQGSGNSALITGTVPMISFSGSPVLRSTLSGGALSHYETFHATGTVHQIHATGGLIWRF
jgi:opacity protein-like surface antigen